MNKFDLMQEKPSLDVPTINYIWDMLWRSSRCNGRKNAEQRARYSELEDVMKMLEEVAEKETNVGMQQN